MPGGRPRKYNKQEVQELIQKFEEYIKKTTVPIISEFAYKNNILRESLYDYPEFSTVLKKAIDKKTANLEIGALGNKINTAMAIFSLKQLGWSDKREIEFPKPITIRFTSNPKGCATDET